MHIILAGMELPPNYGDEYTGRFRQVYRDLAARYGLTLIPFLLEGVGGVAGLNQADGIHPNAEGHQQIAAPRLPRAQGASALDEILVQQQKKTAMTSTEEQPAFIEVNDLHKSYPLPESGQLTVLNGARFFLEAGDTLAVTGQSGSGKSTLIALLAGLDSPDRGRIVINGSPS
jgi:ABC-type multidrug transport system fused ATPase/permease subunit